jgi:gamma-glutamylcysteine synthetase
MLNDPGTNETTTSYWLKVKASPRKSQALIEAQHGDYQSTQDGLKTQLRSARKAIKTAKQAYQQAGTNQAEQIVALKNGLLASESALTALARYLMSGE